MKKTRFSLLMKFGIIFLIFVMVTLIICGITTYLNQSQIYQQQQEDLLQNLSDYLSKVIEKNGDDFAIYQKYFIEHCGELDIPADFTVDDVQRSREIYRQLYAETYPGTILGKDIKFEDLTPEIQKAFTIYNHEYFLLLFEEAREAFGLTYTYYIVPTGEGIDMMYMLDAMRDQKDDVNIDLGIVVDQDLKAHEKEWEAWNTGKAPSGYDTFDNEYGKTYAWYVPLYINGEKLGLIGTEVDIAGYNRAIAINTLHQLVSIALILILTAALTLIFIDRRYIAKILRLSRAVESYAKSKNTDIAKDIRLSGSDELCALSNQTADMILELDDYMKTLVKTTDELTHTREQVNKESKFARMDALTGVRNRNAYEEEVKKLSLELQNGLTKFGFAVVDVNYLKRINDTYGHEMGNISIRLCCAIVCKTFTHSPVFRIGGDEFAVILKNNDYEQVESLIRQFNDYLEQTEGEPWEKVSAAIGYALYDPDKDDCVENVFQRADKDMYNHKREMKALR